MGRRDHPHVDGPGLGLADRAHLALLQHPQQLHLQLRRHVADLIKKDAAAIGGGEQPLVVARRAGEGAAPVAEQLRLQ